jgi:hypothetical protein
MSSLQFSKSPILNFRAARDREVICNLSYPIPNLTYSWCSLFIQTRLWGPNHSGITVPSFAEEML